MSDTGFLDFALAALIVVGMLAGLIILTRPDRVDPAHRPVSPTALRRLNEHIDEQERGSCS